MAKVRNNIVIQGLSGSLGEQLVIKQDKTGRTIVGVSPTFDPNRIFSAAQLGIQERFREAVVYAKDARNENVYIDKAKNTIQSPYNVAIADWFNAPTIHELDVSAWTGQIGQIIRIRAVDDVQVTQVNVVITDDANLVLEQGAAVQVDGSWWTYTTTTNGLGAKIMATAYDLPGNTATFNWN
jgi:hypothetical protein